MTITAYRIKFDRCNGCHVTGHVVEFKIQSASGYMTLRFCYGCRSELKARLDELQRIDNTELDARAAAHPRKTPGDFVCTKCGETMGSWDDFNEYQHVDCGGLVAYTVTGRTPKKPDRRGNKPDKRQAKRRLDDKTKARLRR